jgi:L,D-peptidoglycan transpeptidase YkuD (ErfK/YbiS/YcfS/YnhG family)
MLLAIAAVFFLLISSNEAHTQGTVTVDTFTLQKILQNFDVVLAKFDDKFRM